MKRTVHVIDEEIVDQDRHLRHYHHHRQQQQHHHHDQMIRFDEKVRQIQAIVVQDENMTVNDNDYIIIIVDLIIIIDDHDHDQEDGEFKFMSFFSSRNHSRLFVYNV